MRKALCFVALLLSACGSSEIDRAQEAVRARLNDPASAQFFDVRSFPDGLVCGSFNAKNQLGGYGDKDLFIYDHGVAYTTSDRSDVWKSHFQKCMDAMDAETTAIKARNAKNKIR